MTVLNSLKVVFDSKPKPNGYKRRNGALAMIESREILRKYLQYKITKQKYRKRPMEIQYIKIAKAKKMTYSQVRAIFTELEILGIIETWVVSDDTGMKRKFYRFTKVN